MVSRLGDLLFNAALIVTCSTVTLAGGFSVTDASVAGSDQIAA